MIQKNKFSPQMKIRWTQMKYIREELTQRYGRLRLRGKGTKEKLCAFAPLREILLSSYLCPSDLYLWPIFFLFLSLPVGCAASVASGPSTQSASLSPKSSVDQILDALDARGENLQDFSAKVILTDTDDSSGDSTVNTGSVVLQRKGPDDARIRVAFTKRQVGDKIFHADHQYTLDNGILDDRDYLKKHENRTQVLKPGQKLDLFKLGEGPFPLPLGQKKLFDVAKIDPAKDDPPGTVHVRLTPKDGTQFASRFKTIDVWVDTVTAMPRRIQTDDINQTTTRTTDLSDVKINAGATDKDFAQPPVPPDWDVVEGPYAQ
jgi:outer membrane lipoprotein-sorting protein